MERWRAVSALRLFPRWWVLSDSKADGLHAVLTCETLVNIHPSRPPMNKSTTRYTGASLPESEDWIE